MDVAVLSWLFLVLVAGQDGSPEDLLKIKLRSPFLSQASWITDYDQARRESAKTGKPIFAYFTRSYAPCAPCAEIEGGLFLKEDFRRLSGKYVFFCHITSFAPGQKYQDLLRQMGGEAVPLLLFLDSEGNVLVRHGAARTAEAIDASGAKAREFLDLQAQAEKGGPSGKIDFILVRLELGHIKVGEAEVRIRESGGAPNPKQQKKFDGLKANAEVEAILRHVRTDESKAEAARLCYERRKAGKEAPVSEPWQGAYWNLLLDHAERMKDAAVLEEAIRFLKGKYADVPDILKFLQGKEAALKKLQGEK
jgi:hypothetical protein